MYNYAIFYWTKVHLYTLYGKLVMKKLKIFGAFILAIVVLFGIFKIATAIKDNTFYNNLETFANESFEDNLGVEPKISIKQEEERDDNPLYIICIDNVIEPEKYSKLANFVKDVDKKYSDDNNRKVEVGYQRNKEYSSIYEIPTLEIEKTEDGHSLLNLSWLTSGNMLLWADEGYIHPYDQNNCYAVITEQEDRGDGTNITDILLVDELYSAKFYTEENLMDISEDESSYVVEFERQLKAGETYRDAYFEPITIDEYGNIEYGDFTIIPKKLFDDTANDSFSTAYQRAIDKMIEEAKNQKEEKSSENTDTNNSTPYIEYVYVSGSGSGSKYHEWSGCSDMTNPIRMTKEEAKNLGYTACKKCYN